MPSSSTPPIETSDIREDERYGGVRATFLACLERTRVKMQVDIGLGDAITPGVVAITYPVLLDLPAPQLSGYPVETAIAEKLEAIVDLGRISRRSSTTSQNLRCRCSPPRSVRSRPVRAGCPDEVGTRNKIRPGRARIAGRSRCARPEMVQALL
jgi:hypothetical protein